MVQFLIQKVTNLRLEILVGAVNRLSNIFLIWLYEMRVK